MLILKFREWFLRVLGVIPNKEPRHSKMERPEDILIKISDRVYSRKVEGVESLFNLIPEICDDEILNTKYFWFARFYLNEKELQKAIYYFGLIREELDIDLYNSAHLWLGRIHLDFDIKRAREYLTRIPKEQGNTYYLAQLELEDSYYKQGDYTNSIECILRLLSVDDDVKEREKYFLYLKIANSYRNNSQKNKAREYLRLIPEDISIEYGHALIEYYKLENSLENISNLELINKEYGFAYDPAQYYLGNEAWGNNENDRAIDCWLQVTDKLHWCYPEAQKNLFEKGVRYSLEKNKYDLLKVLLKNINLNIFVYEVEMLGHILSLDSSSQCHLFDLYIIVEKIKKALQVNQDRSLSNYSPYVAHYTTCYVAKIILGKETSGSLQMSVADLMNDPTEGKILHYILGQPKWFIHRFNHRYYQAYASCFSFNHDSLNQFRLYGKDSGKEVTGVSMVFDINMFAHNTFSANISISNGIQKVSKQQNVDNLSDIEKINQDPIKYPIYHCLYYDPKSRYYKLASRAEMTFYRQGKIKGKSPIDIDCEWDKYSQAIKDKEYKLKELFCDLNKTINKLEKLFNLNDSEFLNDKEKVINLISNILLPIQFLVKHAAFIEEDECRMLYITNAGSDEIKEMKDKDGKSRLYIEYEPSVIEYLDKIYLSDGAKDERAFLERAWQKALERDGFSEKRSIDIRDSDNPFRI